MKFLRSFLSISVLLVTVCGASFNYKAEPPHNGNNRPYEERRLSQAEEINKEKLEFLKKQIDDLGKGLDKLSRTYSSESVLPNIKNKEENESPFKENIRKTPSESVGTNENEENPHFTAETENQRKQTDGEWSIEKVEKAETAEGGISESERSSMSLKKLKKEEQLLQEHLESMKEEQRKNSQNLQQDGFDPFGHNNDVKSSDLVLAAPDDEIVNKGETSGEFANRPFLPEELGEVKDFKENEKKGDTENPPAWISEDKIKVADVLIDALMSDVQLLLDNGIGFDEMHKIIQDKIKDTTPSAEEDLEHLTDSAENTDIERQLSDFVM